MERKLPNALVFSNANATRNITDFAEYCDIMQYSDSIYHANRKKNQLDTKAKVSSTQAAPSAARTGITTATPVLKQVPTSGRSLFQAPPVRAGTVPPLALPTTEKCFNCGKPGHRLRECLEPRHGQIKELMEAEQDQVGYVVDEETGELSGGDEIALMDEQTENDYA